MYYNLLMYFLLILPLFFVKFIVNSTLFIALKEILKELQTGLKSHISARNGLFWQARRSAEILLFFEGVLMDKKNLKFAFVTVIKVS